MHAAAADLIEIGQAVGKSKSQFLGRGAASIANVVAAHRKRRPFRQIAGAIFDDVRRQLDCSFRRKDVGAASKVLFEHIVLDEHSGFPNIHTLFSKAAMYIAAIIGPMALAVVRIWRTLSKGISWNNRSISASEPMCTPVTPTSPAARG